MKSYLTRIICSVLCFFALFMCPTSQAHQALPLTRIDSIEKPNGGPRNIIQGVTTVEVIQPTSGYLSIVIYDMQREKIVSQSITYDLKTVISTVGWSKGNYLILTEDTVGDVQDFSIYIE